MDIHFVKSFKISHLETASVNKHFLLVYDNKFFQINESMATLINVINESSTLAEVTEKYNLIKNKNYTEQNIITLIKKHLKPIVDESKTNSKSSFKLKREIFNFSKIMPITETLKVLFKPTLCKILLFISITLICLFFFNTKPFLVSTDISTFLLVGFFFFLSVIFHEFGHASACRYYNIKHGNIGFAIYLYFPVFYADVSNAWTLKRKERIVIDFAGIYFQLIFLIPFLVFYFFTQNEITYFIIYGIIISFLFDLNPFFKFDGYWITSDLLGIPNLRQKTKEIPQYYYDRFIKQKKNINKPFLFELKKIEKISFFIYSILVNLFFCYIFLYRIPIYLFTFLKTFPVQIKEIIFQVSNNELPTFQTLSWVLFQFIIGTLMIYTLFNLLKYLFKIKLISK